MNSRAYDQLNVPTEVEAYIPVQKLFYAAAAVVFQDRSEKRIIEIRIRSRTKVYLSLLHILVGPTVEAWDLAYQRSYCGIIIDL